MNNRENFVQGEDPALREEPIDTQSAWTSGLVQMRRTAAEGRSERRLVRCELAIGVCFQNAGTASQWWLDGEPVLDRIRTSVGGPHDLVILPPGREFFGRSSGGGQCLWIFIDPQSISDDGRVKSFAERARVDCSWAKDHLSRAIITELANECENGFPRGPMFLETASTALIVQLAYFLDGRPPPRVEPFCALSAPKLRLVMEYMESNLDRNVTLTELAALVDLTPRYFCSVFKQAIGRPPHQFQIEQRVERAKSLLRQPPISLTDIALMVGFSSQSHLNAYFRRIVGVTPARYRASILRNKPH